jgi:hypothetical protein
MTEIEVAQKAPSFRRHGWSAYSGSSPEVSKSNATFLASSQVISHSHCKEAFSLYAGNVLHASTSLTINERIPHCQSLSLPSRGP